MHVFYFIKMPLKYNFIFLNINYSLNGLDFKWTELSNDQNLP